MSTLEKGVIGSPFSTAQFNSWTLIMTILRMTLLLLLLLLWYWGLNSGPTPQITPPALFCEGFF
jgi:hypothetical protein